MDVCDVYALNIQPSQLQQVLSVNKDTFKDSEEIRRDFLDWLKERWDNGARFESQLEAWFWYTLFITQEEDEDEEVFERPWLENLWDAAYEKANTVVELANYSFESGGGLPAQG